MYIVNYVKFQISLNKSKIERRRKVYIQKKEEKEKRRRKKIE